MLTDYDPSVTPYMQAPHRFPSYAAALRREIAHQERRPASLDRDVTLGRLKRELRIAEMREASHA